MATEPAWFQASHIHESGYTYFLVVSTYVAGHWTQDTYIHRYCILNIQTIFIVQVIVWFLVQYNDKYHE